MSVSKDPSGKWMVSVRYKDYTGEVRQTLKRGLKTKKEGQSWEREFLRKAYTNLDMTFESFVEIYTSDIKDRVKKNTWLTKENIIGTKLYPISRTRKLTKLSQLIS